LRKNKTPKNGTEEDKRLKGTQGSIWEVNYGNRLEKGYNR